MKKFRILPLIAIATLGGMTLPLVSCRKGNEDKEYDLTIIESPNITVTPTKFKLNQELVIHYTTDPHYIIDEDGSRITIGNQWYDVKSLPHDSSTVTLSYDKVNFETITVNFLAIQDQSNPLCFTSVGENSTIWYEINGSLPNIHIEYKYEGEGQWNDWDLEESSASQSEVLPIANGQKLYVRNTNEKLSEGYNNMFQFSMNGKISASGNINSMINFADVLPAYCFYRLFADCHNLISAPELPTTELADYCYSYMFYDCTSLEEAPDLPATTLANSCYEDMFENCSSLTTAPELPAKTLPYACYYYMFWKCTSLEQTPTFSEEMKCDGPYCCSHMFDDCTSLVSISSLPKIDGQWPGHCLDQMFYNCSNLKIKENDPSGGNTLVLEIDLDASLGDGQVDYMFAGCFSEPGYFHDTPTAGSKYYLAAQ